MAVADILLDAVPAPSWAGVSTAWRLDPLGVAVVTLAGAGYVAGVRRVRRDGGRWPAARTVTFGLGLTGLVVTTMGWPSVYAPLAFSVYAAQMMALLLVIPLLLAIGRPIGLAKAALSPAGVARLDAVLRSRAARPLTVPVVSPLLLAVVPFAVFYTPLYRTSLSHPSLLPVMHVALLAVGLAVLVPLWEADTIAARFPYLVAMLFAFIELLADAVPGIVIRLDTHVIAGDYFVALARPWGSTPLEDQQIGGDLLWCIGEAIDLPFLALLVVQWVRADTRDAAQIDRYLDTLPRGSSEEDALPTAPTAPAARGHPRAPGRDDATERPWWETDASVFGDRAEQYRRRPDP